MTNDTSWMTSGSKSSSAVCPETSTAAAPSSTIDRITRSVQHFTAHLSECELEPHDPAPERYRRRAPARIVDDFPDHVDLDPDPSVRRPVRAERRRGIAAARHDVRPRACGWEV